MTFIPGDRVSLRVLEESELEAKVWTDHVMHSNDHMRYVMTGSMPMRWIDIRAIWKGEREAGDVLFGVWLNATNTFIGTCGLHSHREIYRSWEARFMVVDPAAVGRGLGVEVARMLTDYAFKRLNAHRVWLGVHAKNLAAYKAYLTAGYKVEGTLRDELYCNGEYADAVRMSVLEHEWK